MKEITGGVTAAKGFQAASTVKFRVRQQEPLRLIS